MADESGRELEDLARRTGLSRSELIRRACRLALPKFLSGEIPVVDASAERGAA